jgi:hypothetical protein
MEEKMMKGKPPSHVKPMPYLRMHPSIIVAHLQEKKHFK